MKPCNHEDDEICGCGTYDDALKSAIAVVSDTYKKAAEGNDNGMCLMYQCMMSYAIFCITSRGLILQFEEAVIRAREEGKLDREDFPDANKSVIGMIEDLKKNMSEHMAHSAPFLEAHIRHIVSLGRRTPFQFLNNDKFSATEEKKKEENKDTGDTGSEGRTIH